MDRRTATRNFPGFTPVSRKPRWNGISGRARSRAQTSPLNSRRAKTPRSLSPFSGLPLAALETSSRNPRSTAAPPQHFLRPAPLAPSFDREADLHARPAAVARSRRTGAILLRWENEIGRNHAAAVVTTPRRARGGKGNGERGKLRGADGKVTSLIGARCRLGNCVRASLCLSREKHGLDGFAKQGRHTSNGEGQYSQYSR